MKKGAYIFFGILLIFIIPSVYSENTTITGKTITGESVTGEATNANFGISVILSLELPILEIISPKNNTYISPNNLILNYSALYARTIWYSLNSGINYTINSSVLINCSEGNNILFLYANNSDGNTFTNVSFNVNSTKLIVFYSNFTLSDKGSSTDFDKFSFEELQNLSNILFERTFGKIVFNEPINVSADENYSDFIVNLNNNVNISSNRIYINSTALPNFNKSATIYLYGLTFADPFILKDGVICPSNICTKESYIGGTLKFNVSEFSIYSANETTQTIIVTTSTSSSGGGGGGGTITFIPKIKSFNISEEEIKISSTPGRVITKKLILTNLLNKTIVLTLSEKKLSDFILFKENPISIPPGESEEISFDFIINSEVNPDIYIGKIVISDIDGYSAESVVLLEIESEGALLDVSTKIQPEYKRISAGEQILAEVSLFNVGTFTGKRDILLEYFVKTTDDRTILQYNETVSIETQTNLIKRFEIPPTTKPGKYILYVKAITDGGKIASGSDTFIILNPLAGFYFLIAVLIALLIIVILFIIYFLRKGRKKEEITEKSDYPERREINYPARILIPAQVKEVVEKERTRNELENLRERMLTVSKARTKKKKIRKSSKKKRR
jgi:hypothetical protein